MDEKRALYLAAGAKEFWLCDESGRMTFFNDKGQIKRSKLCPKFPTTL